MKVVERYILSRAFVIFLGALTATLGIVWITQVLTRIDLVTTSGASALTFIQIATLILPSIVPEVLPFAIAIAVAQTFAAMNADSELVIINAAGSPRSAVVRPILLLALAVSIASFAFTNVIDPYAKLTYRRMIADARADLISLVFQDGTFREIEKGLYIQIGEQLSGGDLRSVFLADSRQEGIDLVYYAKTGAVVRRDDKNVLVMNDGEIHRKLPTGDISVISFTSYAFDLSAFSSAAGDPVMGPKDRTLPYLLNPDPNDPVLKRKPQSFRGELHRRFTDWLYPLVFALIALAVAGDARSHREARVNPLITAVMIALFIRWLGFFANNQTQSLPWFWPFIYAPPLGAAVIAIWFIRANRSLELPVALADRLISTLRRIGDQMMFLRLRRSGRDASSGGPA